MSPQSAKSGAALPGSSGRFSLRNHTVELDVKIKTNAHHCRVVLKQDFFVISKTGQNFWTIGKEERGFLFGIGGSGQHGIVAGGMEAKDHLGFGWFFNPQALGADWHAAAAAHPSSQLILLTACVKGSTRTGPS